MKYILYPFWGIICLLAVLYMLLLFIITHLSVFLWQIKPLKFPWKDLTEEGFNYHGRTGYDKNPKETFIRYLTFSEYKNHE